MITLKTVTTMHSMLFAISMFAVLELSTGYLFTNNPGNAITTKHAPPIANSSQPAERINSMSGDQLQFGNFSVSLAVKDLKASITFYEKLDFRQIGGSPKQNYVIMQNDTATIGLFQGMFEKNILTFNPGWNREAKALEKFQDVRDLQTTLKDRGITPVTAADAKSTGPASFVIVDPDGNPILVDQHVAKPK